MVTVTMTKTYSSEEIRERWREGTYINDPYGAIRQMIFEEMIINQLPLRITLDNGEELHAETEV